MMESDSFLLELAHVGWDFFEYEWFMRLLVLLVENDLSRLLYLPIKAFATTILKFNNDTTAGTHLAGGRGGVQVVRTLSLF